MYKKDDIFFVVTETRYKSDAMERTHDAKTNLTVEAELMMAHLPKESIKSTDIQDKGTYKMISFVGGYGEDSSTVTLIYTDDDHTRWLLQSNGKTEANWKLANGMPLDITFASQPPFPWYLLAGLAIPLLVYWLSFLFKSRWKRAVVCVGFSFAIGFYATNYGNMTPYAAGQMIGFMLMLFLFFEVVRWGGKAVLFILSGANKETEAYIEEAKNQERESEKRSRGA